MLDAFHQTGAAHRSGGGPTGFSCPAAEVNLRATETGMYKMAMESPDLIPADAQFSHYLGSQFFEIDGQDRLVMSGQEAINDEQREFFATLIELQHLKRAMEAPRSPMRRGSPSSSRCVPPAEAMVGAEQGGGLSRAVGQARATARRADDATRLMWCTRSHARCVGTTRWDTGLLSAARAEEETSQEVRPWPQQRVAERAGVLSTTTNSKWISTHLTDLKAERGRATDSELDVVDRPRRFATCRPRHPTLCSSNSITGEPVSVLAGLLCTRSASAL